jgi:hypothetical protein
MAYVDMARSHVKELARQGIGLTELVEDFDGDLPFRRGTAAYFNQHRHGRSDAPSLVPRRWAVLLVFAFVLVIQGHSQACPVGNRCRASEVSVRKRVAKRNMVMLGERMAQEQAWTGVSMTRSRGRFGGLRGGDPGDARRFFWHGSRLPQSPPNDENQQCDSGGHVSGLHLGRSRDDLGPSRVRRP